MQQLTFEAAACGQNLLTYCQEQGIYLAAACGGNGTCGKCRVLVTAGAGAPTAQDQIVFSAEELAAGWRLACCLTITAGMAVQLPDADAEEAIEAAADFNAPAGSGSKIFGGAGSPWVVAADIGTTTIAASLVDGASGLVVKTVTGINHQRRFGADVITRIEAAGKGKLALLQEQIAGDLGALAAQLGVDGAAAPFVIAGNTTMEHLLQGLDCRSLGVAPYTPVDISLHCCGQMLIMPGISTFVGADIVSGVVACGMDQSDEIALLIDLGTNGEMVIGNRQRMLAASTAAGPAFEGGNIQCGTAGIPGAIAALTIDGETPQVTTIGGEAPVGICGTGVLETVYELLKAEIVDETGLMDDDYADEGYPLAPGVVFTAQDIREVQLAKSAIRAGMEVLLTHYGIAAEDVERVYLAGGFGQKIDVDKAIGIGLLSEAFAGRIAAVGNSALAGAVMLARDDTLQARFVRVAEMAEEVALAEDVHFSEWFMEYMFFPEDDA
ncbi:ASKHA domain-containing protein [Pseudoramibacter sp. HA2172]|uniref:ASKHA domain-containing protein n=1 Tax=Pseudoramibacter faecis TaxID=3108534 RepID=UPI002E76DA50|nr:ASKHA domain-containing protein [Pseudoramibacter sp. HA2172]